MPRSALLISLSLSGLAASVSAQGARVVDEGSFSITVNGQRVGREDFSIRAMPRGNGVEHLAQATVQYADRRLSPVLVTDSAGLPVTYEIKSRGTSDVTEQWNATIVRGRVSARIQTPRGQEAKEYIVTQGAVIVDDDVFHQYYFVGQRSGGNVTIVIPRRSTQVRLSVSRSGDDRVAIGSRELAATRLVLTEPSGDTREVWIDAQGRVLKVAIPSRGIVALRDEPPR